MSRILCAMSGGVDSSVVAYLLKKEGHEVYGATLKLHAASSAADISDAAEVCRKLDIPHIVYDLSEIFKSRVIDYFTDQYMAGLTPNPCVMCNRTVKLGGLAEIALSNGFEYVATGHYSNICRDEVSGRHVLLRAADARKDQTYVLYSLPQEVLSRLMFPLWNLSKGEIRQIALDNDLINAAKPDSQDICFIPDGDYASYIKRQIDREILRGEYIDKNGQCIGTHKGIIYYTIGQRKGLGQSFNGHRYVLGKNAADNTITLGGIEDLFRSSCTVRDANFLPFERLTAPIRVTVKTRYAGAEQSAVISPCADGVLVEFDAPQKSITPGQSAVFYDGDIVVGGGIIE